jgi:tetratricopeptide (TPR) repeat protein
MHFIRNLIHLMENEDIQKGLDCYNRGAFERAIDHLERAYRSFTPDEQAFKTAQFYLTESYISLAKLSLEEEDYISAIYNYRKALELNPGFADIHNKLGTLFHQKMDYESAISCFKKALEINKNYFTARMNLGYVYIDLGNLEEATKEFDTLIVGRDDESKEDYAKAKVLLSQSSLDLAKDLLFKAFSLPEDIAQKHYHNAQRLYHQGRLEEAKNELDTALTENPCYADVHNLLGIINLNLGNIDDAMVSIKEAIEINANYVTAHFNMGFILLEQEMYDEAAEEFRKILEIDPENKIAASILNEIGKESTEKE